MVEQIRIVIVDDHDVVRQGFKYFIDVTEHLELVGEAKNGQDAIQVIKETVPDVVLIDMKMPKLNGVETIRAIKATHPHIKFIALTSFVDDESLVEQALDAGASGYFFKNVTVDELAEAVHRVYEGEMTLGSGATKLLIKARTIPREPIISFTEREIDVAQLMVEGLNNREIGEKLFISRATVKFHISSILSKVSASSRTEATAIIIQKNLLKN
ncbi:MAG: response regulator transcription factor [Chloroflexota bacterium]